MIKQQIRKSSRENLKALKEQEIRALSEKICLNLVNFIRNQLKRRYTHILAYQPFFHGEVYLSSLVNSCYDSKFYIPHVTGELNLDFFETTELEKFDGVIIDFAELQNEQQKTHKYDTSLAADTLVIVPGLAFDRTGARLGRGKGCYDRFLAQSEMKPATKIAVCFKSQLIEKIPLEEFDVMMDWVCTESEVFPEVKGL